MNVSTSNNLHVSPITHTIEEYVHTWQNRTKKLTTISIYLYLYVFRIEMKRKKTFFLFLTSQLQLQYYDIHIYYKLL